MYAGPAGSIRYRPVSNVRMGSLQHSEPIYAVGTVGDHHLVAADYYSKRNQDKENRTIWYDTGNLDGQWPDWLSGAVNMKKYNRRTGWGN